MLKPYIRSKMEEFKEDTGISLKRNLGQKKMELYNFMKSTYEEALGAEVSHKEFFKVYGILLYLSIPKKDVEVVLSPFDRDQKDMALENLEVFHKHLSGVYTKKGEKYLFNHVLMRIVRKLVETEESWREFFTSQILRTNQKKVILDPQKYENAIMEKFQKIKQL